MYRKEDIERVSREREKWEEKVVAALRDNPEARAAVVTDSGVPIKWLYTPEDLRDFDYLEKVNFPGEYPYVRGVYPTMHRGRLWTTRLVSGFASGEAANERLRFLLQSGETGLNVVVDMPTHAGYDADDPQSEGEVGLLGVSISCLDDMEELFRDIPIDKISVSLIANATAPEVMAMYIAMAEKRGLDLKRLEGSVQNDMLKEYEVVGCAVIVPPEAALKMSVDIMEYCTEHLPRWNTITFNGHCIRENGVTAVQEVAFNLSNARTYIKALLERGRDIDDFAPRLAFLFGVHNNFFEEIATFRAARRLYAKMLREEFKAKSPRSWLLRTAAMTCGSTLTTQQPLNNVIRIAFQALAGVIGGCQSLATCSYDEGLGIPTEEAARLAVRTQQIMAYESGVADTIDPMGGSYYLESLTDALEGKIAEYMERIENEGGVIAALKKGFFEREVTEVSQRRAGEIDRGERVVVGVNRFQVEEELPVQVYKVDERYEQEHREKLARLRKERDNERVAQILDRLREAIRGEENLMPATIEAVKAGATVGEICAVKRELYGAYKPTYLAAVS